MFKRKDTYTIPEGYREELTEGWVCLGYRGNVEADEACLISEDCQIVGKVHLGYRSAVYRGAVLRADSDTIRIGAETNIQENCVLHETNGLPLIVGEHTTVGHGAILHGCTIGDNVLVGMGAVVMDGARVGNNCVIAAGALVPEGMEVPDCHMALGVPAKVRGPLSQDKIDLLCTYYTEANLVEADNMREAGLLHHPSPELLRKIGAIR